MAIESPYRPGEVEDRGEGILRGAGHLLDASSRLWFAGLAIVRVVVGLADLLVAGILYELFLLLQHGSPMARMPSALSTTSGLALFAAVILLLRSLLDIVSMRSLVSCVETLYARLVDRLIRGYGAMRWTRFVQRNRSELLNHMTQTARNAASFYAAGMELLAATIVVVAMAGVIIFRSPWSALAIVCVVGAFYSFHRYFIRGRMQVASARREASLQHLNKSLAEALSAGKEIRTARHPDFIYIHIAAQARDAAVCRRQTESLPQIARILADQGVVLVFLALILIVSLRAGDAHQLLPLLVFYFVLSRRLLPLISQISFLAGHMESFFANVTLISNELFACERFAAPVRSAPLPSGGLALELRDVSFSFEPEAPILRNVNLSLRSGEILVVCGASGSGKTSMLHLIAGILEPDAGRVHVDRESLAYVPQETTLLDDSIRKNLLFGRSAAADAELTDALETAGLREWFAALPAGLDTQVGDNGVLLSGGQRQRLGLARAILRRPALLLLDEVTSSLDLMNESRVLKNLCRAGHAVLMVTHRAHPVLSAHRAVRLQNGALHESGAALLAGSAS